MPLWEIIGLVILGIVVLAFAVRFGLLDLIFGILGAILGGGSSGGSSSGGSGFGGGSSGGGGSSNDW